ncbi:MAG: amino acid permease, partial [Verrucomicrobiota bacterium]
RLVLPDLALVVGTGIVTLLYVALNAAFLRVIPEETLRGELEVGYLAARSLFGAEGATWMGLLIAFGLLSTISSLTWAGPRVSQVVGEDYSAFRWLMRKNAQGAPIAALLLQAVVVCVLLGFALFEQILLYIQSILTLSSLLVVGSVFWLRWKRPEVSRPFRTWGYPVTPLVFLLMSGYSLVILARDRPWEMLWGLATLIAGVAVYWGAKRRESVS